MSSAGRTHWMLEEIGVRYEYHRVSARDGGTRKPEFLAVNPGGKVPAIVDDGLHLAESVAINFYLAERYKPELFGKDLKERALVYQWSLWAMTNLQPELLTIVMNTYFLPEAERDPEAVEVASRMAKPLLVLIDQALIGTEYLVGDQFTVADVNAGSVVNLARHSGLLQDLPHVTAWLVRVTSRPDCQKALKDA
jgi:glutathione S-transferase